MELKVKFMGTGGSWAIQVDKEPTGLWGVDCIRRELGVELPLDRIWSEKESWKWDYSLKVDEEFARTAGDLWLNKNVVTVYVPGAFLNEYLVPVVRHKKDEETGEILEAWLDWAIHDDRLLEDWQAAGYPLDWDVQKEGGTNAGD